MFDLQKCERDKNGHWLCQTRDGRKARVVTSLEGTADQCLVVCIMQPFGKEMLGRYELDGSFWNNKANDPADLINIPAKRSGWVNVYDKPHPHLNVNDDQPVVFWSGVAAYTSKADAEKWAQHAFKAFGLCRIACVQITFTEGEGLEGKV